MRRVVDRHSSQFAKSSGSALGFLRRAFDHSPGVRCRIVEVPSNFHRGVTVDNGMMQLGGDGKTRLWHAFDVVQAFDDAHFPEGGG